MVPFYVINTNQSCLISTDDCERTTEFSWVLHRFLVYAGRYIGTCFVRTYSTDKCFATGFAQDLIGPQGSGPGGSIKDLAGPYGDLEGS